VTNPHPLQPWCDRKGGRLQLARDAGVTWQTINEIAQGRRRPRADLALRISRATGGAVSAAELMGLDPHQPTLAPAEPAKECA
jgi:DNA-binding transcriptional regulator YdaS (Cro superfamily)